ncbi:MAG: S9 family peptidase [Candidatus Paracaedibacteraceae bacterium]|nr:S9 family peptidase [Candidatus Paracaedibacteraceae bacterium]
MQKDIVTLPLLLMVCLSWIKKWKGAKTGKTRHTLDGGLIQLGNTADIRKANSATTYLTHLPGAKMLLMAGLKDNICSSEQSESLYKQMVALRNHVELVTMAEEGHMLAKDENRFMSYRVMEQFLGDITAHPYEPNGYGTLVTTSGVVYHRSAERSNND